MNGSKEKPTQETGDLNSSERAKIYVDLWMHQNILHWSTLKTVILLQGAFVTISYIARDSFQLRLMVFFFVLVFSFIAIKLWHGHALVRNSHTEKLKDFGVNPLEPESGSGPLHWLSFKKRISGKAVFLAVIFLFGIIDLLILYGIPFDLLKTNAGLDFGCF